MRAAHFLWFAHALHGDAQVDELIDAEKYAEALALLKTIDVSLLPDKVSTYHTTHENFR